MGNETSYQERPYNHIRRLHGNTRRDSISMFAEDKSFLQKWRLTTGIIDIIRIKFIYGFPRHHYVYDDQRRILHISNLHPKASYNLMYFKDTNAYLHP